MKQTSNQNHSMQSSEAAVEQGLALFDFDGTLTRRDSFLAFILFSQPRWRLVKGLVLLMPSLFLYACKQLGRQTMKERALSRFFGHWSKERLNSSAERFAAERLDALLRPEVIPLLAWHQERGHCCVLVSASIETYLIPWARRHGFRAVLASQLEFDKGTVTGRLAGENCWGPEKLRRIHQWLDGRQAGPVYAYGDTRGDREMLEFAQHRFYRQLPLTRTDQS